MAWWALYSEPGRTLLARDEMSSRGFDVVCPVERLTKRRKLPNRNAYKAETVLTPVFGSYLFAHARAPSDVTGLRGVGGAVKTSEGAVSVRQGVIDTLRAACTFVEGAGDLMGARNIAALSYSYKGQVGSQVRFVDGPFLGFVGVITSLARLDIDGSVQATLDMLGKTHQINVAHSALKVLPKAA